MRGRNPIQSLLLVNNDGMNRTIDGKTRTYHVAHFDDKEGRWAGGIWNFTAKQGIERNDYATGSVVHS